MIAFPLFSTCMGISNFISWDECDPGQSWRMCIALYDKILHGHPSLKHLCLFVETVCVVLLAFIMLHCILTSVCKQE